VGKHQPKYSITTVTEMTGVPAQQLRRMEQASIIKPARSAGGTRRYSDADVAQVERARDLADSGINQAGIERIIALEDALQAANERTAVAEAEVKRLRHAQSQSLTGEEMPPSIE
jgi:DNA-binding transcriptional MerR regulator